MEPWAYMMSPGRKWREAIRRTHAIHLAGGMLRLNRQETMAPTAPPPRSLCTPANTQIAVPSVDHGECASCTKSSEFDLASEHRTQKT